MSIREFINWIRWTGKTLPRREDYQLMFHTDKEKECSLFIKMYPKVRKVALYGIKQYMRKSVYHDRATLEFGVNLDYSDFIPCGWHIHTPASVALGAFNRCITEIRRELGGLGYYTLSNVDSPTSKYELMIFLSREAFVEHVKLYCQDQLNYPFNAAPMIEERLARVDPDQSVIWKNIVGYNKEKPNSSDV